MAKQKRARSTLLDTTFQAICREGDFTGDRLATEDAANKQAGEHQRQPGCDDHIIDIVTIKKTSRAFKAD